MGRTLRGRDLISIDDLSGEEIRETLALAAEMKRHLRSGRPHETLRGKTLAMLFEKPSLRTRVTFEVSMRQLGGSAVYLAPQDVQLGLRESVRDVAANLSRWVDAIVARTFAHRTVVELADGADVPVINGLSDHEHPCQVLADLQTIHEKLEGFAGRTVAWVGDGNNVCHSLLLAAAKVGLSVNVATPPGYEPHPQVVASAQAQAERSGGAIRLTNRPADAVRGAQAVYTDVWTSMGREAEREERARVFAPFQVNAQLLAAADPQAIVLHCLPAHRGEEITDEVLDGPRSVVLDQAENRLHAQKALLALVMA
ncbi:MAG: ornithine carbamoyltransferase [Armatimonadota bacterium]|nr:ornithine carbamoyltransferase [Armatimonadota bacterium]MDR5697988.1 ornithine carbamoyltransferase [Armatimonadota bacterium]